MFFLRKSCGDSLFLGLDPANFRKTNLKIINEAFVYSKLCPQYRLSLIESLTPVLTSIKLMAYILKAVLKWSTHILEGRDKFLTKIIYSCLCIQILCDNAELLSHILIILTIKLHVYVTCLSGMV